MTYPTDRSFTLLTQIAECLCSQINDTDGVPGVCFCGVVPGENAHAAYAGECDDSCGMAWVRMITSYPAKALGQVDSSPGNCGSGLGMEIELGIMRCIRMEEQAPDEAELLDAVHLQMVDAAIMRRAIWCCSAIPTKEAIVTSYTPIGPEGGLVGGTMNVAVGVL